MWLVPHSLSLGPEMSAEETQRLLDLLSRGELGLSWTAYAIVGLVSLVGAFLGAYFKRRGENYATKQDLRDLTTIAEGIRANIANESWQNQRFWEEKKIIYLDLIRGINRIADALWEHLLNGFDQRTHQQVQSPGRQASVKSLLESLDRYLQYTGVAFVFLSADAHEAMSGLAAKSKNHHDRLVADNDAYAYYSDLKKAVDEAYDRMIKAARTDLAAELRKP